MNIYLLKLALWLEKNIRHESYLAYDLFKEAMPSKQQEDNRKFFEQKFPNENINKTYAIADQYFKTFKDQPDFQKNLQEVTDFAEIIRLIQNNKETLLTPKQQIIKELSKKHPDIDKEISILEKSNVEPQNYEWAVKIYMGPEQDAIEEIISSIEFYQKNKNDLAKDLQSFNKLSELRTYFDEVLASNKDYYFSKIKSHALDPKNTSVVYNSNNFVVVLSGTIQSSQYWAKGTTWCTSYLENNMFAHYSSKGIYLYYALTKEESEKFNQSNPLKKMCIGYIKKDGAPQLVTEQNATVDINNHNLKLNDIENYFGEESDSIFSNIMKDLARREDTKFNEIISETTLDGYHNQLKMITDKSQIIQFKNIFANSPSANPEILRELYSESKSYRPDLLGPLARNGGLPDDIYNKLLDRAVNTTDRQFLLENICANTKTKDEFIIAQLSNPNIGAYLKENIMFLLQGSDKRINIFPILANDPEISFNIASMIAKSDVTEALSILTQLNNELLLPALSENTYTPSKDLVILANKAINPQSFFAESTYETILNLIDNKNSTSEVFNILLNTKSVAAKKYMANSPQTPPEILSKLVRIPNVAIIDSALGNKNMPTEILVEFLNVSKETGTFKHMISQNESAPRAVSEQLSKDRNTNIRSNVASNAGTPPDILAYLSNDSETDVRMDVARNINTDVATLYKLLEDKSPYVARAVISNKNLSMDMLEKLSKHWDEGFREEVAKNKKATPEMLNYLSKDRVANVRRHVAGNKNTPINILQILMNDPDTWVADAARGTFYILERDL